NFEFFRNAPNALDRFLPEDAASMAELVKLIVVPEVTGGLVLELVMDDSENEAVIGFLNHPSD
ncbi:MAG TPA: hypothetical protein PLI95_18895, partial [Polyangiaceae bacterium]|nr:hypothetical protein [Polyangiaceae bacterium]